ncbi:MAG: DUF6291 domain-containing protein [Porcipelethomonas sp.]
MGEKKSFVLYNDYRDEFEAFSGEQCRQLILALFDFNECGRLPEISDGMVRIAMLHMSKQMKRDREKWEDTCRKRSEAVKKRWDKRKNTSVYNSIQDDTPCTDNENENADVNEKDKDTDNTPPLSPGGDEGECRKAFEKFWDIYPKKVSAKKAYEQWRRIVSGKGICLADAITASVMEHIRSDEWQRENGRFIPNPDKFLRDRRFEDQVTSAPEKKDYSFDIEDYKSLVNNFAEGAD